MEPDLVTRIWNLLPAFLLAAVFVTALAALLSWVLGRAASGEALKSANAVNAVMTATALRRDRRQTLTRILEVARESLGAASGTLHLGQGRESLELVSAVGVRRSDLLERVPAGDAVLVAAGREVVVAPVALDSHWAALSDGRPGTLAAVSLHGGRATGVLALCWPDRGAATAAAYALAQIGAYIDQVLGEFDALGEQARSIQMINETLATQVTLTRAAAHDMGNMVSGATGFIDLLQQLGGLNETLAPMGERAKGDLLLLRQTLKDFTSPDRPLELAVVSIDDLVNVAAAMGSDKVADGDGTFRLDVPAGLPSVWGERLAILRVLDNLIRNAVKHNKGVRQLQVTLSVRLAEDCVQFSVRDNGAGIPAEAQARLFGFGVRLDPKGSGHGIGLWSCRRLVEAHGGRIWVESEPGNGATFAFTIPITTEALMRRSIGERVAGQSLARAREESAQQPAVAKMPLQPPPPPPATEVRVEPANPKAPTASGANWVLEDEVVESS